MNIGQAAKHTGLPAKTIRYYEEIGLVVVQRDSNGYRAFADTDLHMLTFLARARALGFGIEDCRSLLALYQDGQRSSSDVKAIARHHLEEIQQKILDLKEMQATLSELVSACSGDSRPDCPILKSLGQN